MIFLDLCRNEIQNFDKSGSSDDKVVLSSETTLSSAAAAAAAAAASVSADNSDSLSSSIGGGGGGGGRVSQRPFVRGMTAAAEMSSITIHRGDPIIEKKSIFLASFAVIDSLEGVNRFRNILISDKKIARATHNIMAYRFTCPRTGALYHDNDDDGETAAAGRIAEMIRYVYGIRYLLVQSGCGAVPVL